MQKLLLVIVLGFVLLGCSSSKVKNTPELPKGFVYLSETDPSIIQEIRYAGNHNLLGRPVPGYQAAKCILTRESAQALSQVQSELKKHFMSLKVYDCYRPQKAVNSLVVWAKASKDSKMKKEFYPKIEKSELLKEGWISENSPYSRGSTIDLTVVTLPASKQTEYREKDRLQSCAAPVGKRFRDNSMDFGTGYDCFHPYSKIANSEIGTVPKQNRAMLKSVMEKKGFKNNSDRWWSYTFSKEPFSQAFDFPVQ